MDNQHALFLDRLERLIQNKHMLKHPFYQAWTCGHLTKETLQRYAQEYYHHVKAFPTYLSALHSRCDDLEVRKCLLDNLMDEEAGQPNHPDLWRSFAISLGVGRDDLSHHQPKSETQQLIAHFRGACSTSSLAVGISALYSYESQIPAICQTKIEGLQKWYGITDPEAYRYFSVHETADIEHSHQERELLKTLIQPEEEETILANVNKTLDHLWQFLSSFGEQEMQCQRFSN